MGVLTQRNYLPDWLKYEESQDYSRANVTILAGSGSARVLTAGMVIGFVPSAVAVSAAKAGGNTGNGTLVVDATTPALPGVQPGVYTATCTVAAANAATFQVVAPDGAVLGTVAFNGSGASGTFSNQIKFAVTDAGTDFIVGDAFTITVQFIGAGKWQQLNLAGTNGSQIAAGILATDITAPDGVDVVGAAVVRNAKFVSSMLTWPAGITTAQKNVAIGQLRNLGLIETASS